MKPLQTHNQYIETWRPPQSDRFTVYQQSDESWLRPLGFGTVDRVLAPLYDVRLITDESLIGYISQDPTHHRDGRMPISCLLDPPSSFDYLMKGGMHDRETLNITTIVLRIRHYAIGPHVFQCWFAVPEDVPALVRSSYLTFGPDNKERFVHELMRKEYERRDHLHFNPRFHSRTGP